MTGGSDAVKEGKKPEGCKSEHKGDAPGRVSPEASGRRSFKFQSKDKEAEEKLVDDIKVDFLKGGDVGVCFSRLVDEVKSNRGELLRIQSLLEKM